MRSLNRVMLIGHLAADPELRETKSGKVVANFPLATNRFVRDENGEKREVADFHKVLAWGRLGEICQEYLVKGVAIFLEGRIINSSFDDKEGHRHYRTEIVADGVNILTWKKTKNGSEEVEIESLEEEEEAVAV